MPFSTPFCTASSRSTSPSFACCASQNSQPFVETLRAPMKLPFYLGTTFGITVLGLLLAHPLLARFDPGPPLGFKERSRSTLTGHSRIFKATLVVSRITFLSPGKHIYCDLPTNVLGFAAIQAGSVWAPPVSCAIRVARIGLLPITQDSFFATTSTDSLFRPEAKHFEQTHHVILSNQDLSFLLLINEDARLIQASLNNSSFPGLITLEVNDQRKQIFKLWLPRLGIKRPSSHASTFIHSLHSRHIEFDSNINVAVRAMLFTSTTTEQPESTNQRFFGSPGSK